MLGFAAEDAILVSAKTGQGIDELISKLCDQLPAAARASPTCRPRALIFDSIYDDYRGVIAYVRVVDGELRKGQKIRFMGTDSEYQITDLGKLMPRPKQVETHRHRRGRFHRRGHQGPARRPHRRHRHRRRQPRRRSRCPATSRSSRWSSATSTPAARRSTTSCATRWTGCSSTTARFTFEPESSDALGFGFRCGFLGLLHMEIIQERLEREFNIEVVQTAPTVTYEVMKTDGTVDAHRLAPASCPNPTHVEEIREPFIQMNLILPGRQRRRR